MALPGFGFSVGDFIAGAQVLARVIDAFKEAGGASSKYVSQVSFLQGFKITLEHIEGHVRASSPSDLSDDISKLLSDIRGPWNESKNFLKKYDDALGQTVNKPTKVIRKFPRVIRFTMSDMSSKVDTLRQEIQQPLAAINSLLLLHVIESLQKLPDQTLRPEHSARLVEVIRLADIPAELDKQIRVLKRTADEHNVKQDKQLEVIKKLRTQLDGPMANLQIALDKMKSDTVADSQHDIHHDVDLLASLLESHLESLGTTMKNREQTIEELKSFLEDKALKEKADKTHSMGSSNPWPSGTLSTAYFATSLLSTIVSTCTATSLISQRTRDRGIPTQDRSLPGLDTQISDHGSGRAYTLGMQPDTNTNRKAPTRKIGLAAED